MPTYIDHFNLDEHNSCIHGHSFVIAPKLIFVVDSIFFDIKKINFVTQKISKYCYVIVINIRINFSMQQNTKKDFCVLLLLLIVNENTIEKW